MADFSSSIGESTAIRNISSLMERVIKNQEISVLICGETGKGKEIVARAIHDNSATGDELFIEVNCAVIPEHLLESELFGYEKGAYTSNSNQLVIDILDDGVSFEEVEKQVIDHTLNLPGWN